MTRNTTLPELLSVTAVAAMFLVAEEAAYAAFTDPLIAKMALFFVAAALLYDTVLLEKHIAA